MRGHGQLCKTPRLPVTWWQGALVVTAGAYMLALAGLALAGRRADATAVARMVPDLVVLVSRLARDARVPRGRRALLAALALYLASPIDLVPDFLPLVGVLDDALLVVLVLRAIVRAAGPGVVAEHWPGPPRGLELLLGALS